MRLRVNQAELRFNLRPQPHAQSLPLRVHLTNECGFLLEIFLYRYCPLTRTCVSL